MSQWNFIKGWNEVLVKVGKSRGTPSGFYAFSFRVADENGTTLSQVAAGTSPNKVDETSATSSQMRWYRIQVPPGCVAVVPPVFHGPYRMLLNGQELRLKGDAPIDIQSSLHDEKNTLVIIARKETICWSHQFSW